MSFNRDFAAKTFDIISGMDDDAAVMFTRFVTYDVLMEDMKNNERTISKAVGEILFEIKDEVSKSLLEREGDPVAVSSAALVSVVSKDWATNFEELYHKPQPRDKSGRWSVSIQASKEKNKPRKLTRNEKRDLRVGNFNVTGALGDTGQITNRFSDKWNERANEESSTSRMFQRVEAGSRLLTDTGNATGNAKLRLAGDAGQFLGKYGPQAESVVGPHMRRTAYRYRGTERTADSALIRSANDHTRAILHNEGLSVGDVNAPIRNTASTEAAVQYLMGRLPSKRLADLQQKSGKIPPSEGVIINGDGKIITQAVGYMDDHYLPFNLKNLKGLQGGSYVRTRSSGGLTTEDIYTGLIAGARSVTVVSRSGVFTVDFEDDFRGGRRYNDKAAQMVGRYAKTLDAVKSQQVTRKPMSIEDRLRIRDEVETEAFGLSPAEIEDEIKRRIADEQSRPSLSSGELEEINRKAVEAAHEGGQAPRGQFTPREWERIKDDPKKRILAYRSQMIEDALAEKEATKFQLDGEGYAVAMEALKEQFPYYIQQVKSIHNKDPRALGLGLSHEKDTGYVKPRFNRPEGAKEGYFDPSITGGGKVSADQTNYQNWSQRKGRMERVDGEKVTVEDKPARQVPEAAKVKDNIERGKKQAAVNEQMRGLVAEAKGVQMERGEFPILTQVRDSEDELTKVFANPTQFAKLEDEIRNLASRMGDEESEFFKTKAQRLQTGLRVMDAHRISLGNERWDDKKFGGGKSPEQPYLFDGPEYESGQSPEVYQHGWQKLNEQAGRVIPGFVLPDSQERMKEMSNTFGSLYNMAQQSKAGTLDEGTALQQIATALPQADAARIREYANVIVNNPDMAMKRWSTAVEMLERARRINAVAGDSMKARQPANTQVIQGSATTLVKPKAADTEDAHATRNRMIQDMDDRLAKLDDSETHGILSSIRNGLARKGLEFIQDPNFDIAMDELFEKAKDLYDHYEVGFRHLGWNG